MNARKSSIKPGLRRMPVGKTVLLVVAVLLAASGWTVVGTTADQQGGVLRAQFTDASPLLEGSDVKVHGVKVGSISAIRLAKPHEAVVSMKLDSSAYPIHTDAHATIRAVSLLGERYLDLDRGSDAAPALRPGEVLPTKQTAQSTDLDQVLDTVDQPTGDALSALIGTLGEGLDGNGQNARKAIAALEPAMRDTGKFSRILHDQNGVLNDLVDKLGPVTKALADDHGKSLDGLMSSANQVTAVTAARQRELNDTLEQLPATLTDASRTLSTLTSTARQTTPSLRALRPATDNLDRISAELQGFTASANPALGSAEPVLDHAKQLLEQARPVADQLRAASPNLRGVVSNARPVVTDLSDNFGNVLNFLRYWALTTNGYDGISHYFRAHLSFDANITLGSVLPELLGKKATGIPSLNQPPPGAAGGAQPQRPAPGPIAQEQPHGLGGVLSSLLGKQGSQPSGLLAPQKKPDGSATGLSAQQESNAMQFLIGGGN
ncbi:MlaD family protein [Sciscionella sediminilitoris]|uniref:MlaD family protein n=1 Tax=Sciscionella sediminilitoris TaxID=1445613 RepID=UPI0012E20D07|nr:MlaD family protein [Sciscionella sp. SE31]